MTIKVNRYADVEDDVIKIIRAKTNEDTTDITDVEIANKIVDVAWNNPKYHLFISVGECVEINPLAVTNDIADFVIRSCNLRK